MSNIIIVVFCSIISFYFTEANQESNELIQWKLSSKMQNNLSISNLQSAIWQSCDYPLSSINIQVTTMIQIDNQYNFFVNIYLLNLTSSHQIECLSNTNSITTVENHFHVRSGTNDWKITPVISDNYNDATSKTNQILFALLLGFIVFFVIGTMIFCVCKRRNKESYDLIETPDTLKSPTLTMEALKPFDEQQNKAELLLQRLSAASPNPLNNIGILINELSTTDDSLDSDDTLEIIDALDNY